MSEKNIDNDRPTEFSTVQLTEEQKMQNLKKMILDAEDDIKHGRLTDGEIFMQELIDGKHDKD